MNTPLNFNLPADAAKQLSDNRLANAADKIGDVLAQAVAGIGEPGGEKILRPTWHNLQRLQGSLRRLVARLEREARQRAQQSRQDANAAQTRPETGPPGGSPSPAGPSPSPAVPHPAPLPHCRQSHSKPPLWRLYTLWDIPCAR